MGAVLGEGSVAGRGGHCGGQQGGAGIGLLSFSTLPLWSHHYHHHYIIAKLRRSDSSLHIVFFGIWSVSLREKPSQKKHPFFWAVPKLGVEGGRWGPKLILTLKMKKSCPNLCAGGHPPCPNRCSYFLKSEKTSQIACWGQFGQWAKEIVFFTGKAFQKSLGQK